MYIMTVIRKLSIRYSYEKSGQYHMNAFARDEVTEKVRTLMANPQVTNKRGIFEYVLGGEKDMKLLNVRVFDQRRAEPMRSASTG